MDFAAFLSNLGNNLGFGLTVTLIGIAIVFLGLTILIGLIKLMENATANLGKGGKKAKKQAEAPAPAPVAAPVVEEVPVADDSELIAVISAAVAMMMEDGSAFTVRRVRRVQNAHAHLRRTSCTSRQRPVSLSTSKIAPSSLAAPMAAS